MLAWSRTGLPRMRIAAGGAESEGLLRVTPFPQLFPYRMHFGSMNAREIFGRLGSSIRAPIRGLAALWLKIRGEGPRRPMASASTAFGDNDRPPSIGVESRDGAVDQLRRDLGRVASEDHGAADVGSERRQTGLEGGRKAFVEFIVDDETCRRTRQGRPNLFGLAAEDDRRPNEARMFSTARRSAVIFGAIAIRSGMACNF